MNTLLRPLVPLATLSLWAMLGASGCGQKGPLYLPDPAPQTVPENKGQTRKTPRLPDPVTAQ